MTSDTPRSRAWPDLPIVKGIDPRRDFVDDSECGTVASLLVLVAFPSALEDRRHSGGLRTLKRSCCTQCPLAFLDCIPVRGRSAGKEFLLATRLDSMFERGLDTLGVSETCRLATSPCTQSLFAPLVLVLRAPGLGPVDEETRCARGIQDGLADSRFARKQCQLCPRKGVPIYPSQLAALTSLQCPTTTHPNACGDARVPGRGFFPWWAGAHRRWGVVWCGLGV